MFIHSHQGTGLQVTRGFLWLLGAALLGLLLVLPHPGHAQTITTISMVNDSFRPQTVTVPIGTTVLWLNDDMHYHSITSDTGLFDSGTLYQGNSFQFRFPAPGTYYYHCRFHGNSMSGMWGMITVTGNSYGAYNSYNPYSSGYSSYQNQNYNYNDYNSYPYSAYGTGNSYSSSYSYPYSSSYTYPYSSSYTYPGSSSYSTSPYYSPYSNTTSSSYTSPYNNYNSNYPYYSSHQRTTPSTFNLSCSSAGSMNYWCSYAPSFYTNW